MRESLLGCLIASSFQLLKILSVQRRKSNFNNVIPYAQQLVVTLKQEFLALILHCKGNKMQYLLIGKGGSHV
jgi:hypothetical protein